MNFSTPPNVLLFAGLDPSGGAGLQADIQTLSALQCHPLPIATCLTVQDTHNVQRVESVDADLLHQQAEVILADMPIAAVKIGVISDLAVLEAIAVLVANLKCPVVVDPVLKAGGGANFSNATLQQAFCRQLLPQTSVITPNSVEARQLSGETDLAQAAAFLLAQGCEAVLLSGGHESGDVRCNTLYQKHTEAQHFPWQARSGAFHGTGCTLASALSAALAQGLALPEACQQAQTFTTQAVTQAFPAGKGQWIPQRWAKV